MHKNQKLYPHDEDLQVERKEKRLIMPEYFTLFLILLPMFAGLFAAWAMVNLHLEVTASVIGKAALIGVVVAIVSYAINRFAIDWGAELAASGYSLAGVFSVVSMMVVGGFLWFFSFGGIVLPDVRVLRYEDHGIALSQNLQLRQEQASKAMRVVTVIASARDDFSFHSACETSQGCISGRGGGAGTISRVLDERSRRAGNIAEQLDAGTQEFASIVIKANDVLIEYQRVLNDDALTLKERRQELIRLDGVFISIASGLEEAIPLALIGAYAQELLDGVVIPNRGNATRTVNALLRKHGQVLQSVLGGIGRETIERTQFPGKAGLSDTLDYVGNFAPLAGVIWVAEGIFPLALWIYTLLFLLRQRERSEANAHSDPNSSSPTSSKAHGNASGVDDTQETNPRKRRRRRGKGGLSGEVAHLNGSASIIGGRETQNPKPQNLKVQNRGSE
jgi:hypothetical protein